MQEKMSQETEEEEAATEMTHEEVLEEGAGVVGSAESDELEAKTQENPHPHPMRPHERMKELRETSRRCGTGYGRWSGDTPQEWKIGRLVQTKNELCVMMMKELLGQIRR